MKKVAGDVMPNFGLFFGETEAFPKNSALQLTDHVFSLTQWV
jgi:hypothetical protein